MYNVSASILYAFNICFLSDGTFFGAGGLFFDTNGGVLFKAD